MRKSTALVFDDFVAATTIVGNSTPVYSSDQLNKLLASADQMAFQLIADQIRGAGTNLLNASLETSGNHRNWYPKVTLVTSLALVAGSLKVAPYCADLGLIGALGASRLNIFLNTTSLPASARIRIYATLRDPARVLVAPPPPKATLVGAAVHKGPGHLGSTSEPAPPRTFNKPANER